MEETKLCELFNEHIDTHCQIDQLRSLELQYKLSDNFRREMEFSMSDNYRLSINRYILGVNRDIWIEYCKTIQILVEKGIDPCPLINSLQFVNNNNVFDI